MSRKSPAGNPLPDPGTLGRMVLVYWRDCWKGGATSFDTAAEAWPYMLGWTVGIVVRDDEDGLVLAQDQFDYKDDDRLRGPLGIPRDAILHVWDLPDPREKE